MSMSNAAIPGLVLDASVLSTIRSGFQVVGADRNACPRHFGLFVDADAAAAYRAACDAEAASHGAPDRFKVKAWKARR